MILGIYGSGGAGRETKEIAIELNQWHEVIFIDDNVDNDIFHGIRRMSFTEFNRQNPPETAEVVIAVGEPQIRETLYNKVKDAGYKLGNVIHPYARVSTTAVLGNGIVLHAGVVINANAVIKDNVIIQEQACIGHDTVIKMHCYLAACVTFGGSTEVGERAYIGISAAVRDHIKIGTNTIVGMGSIVVKDIPDSVVVMGNPARIIKSSDGERVFK